MSLACLVCQSVESPSPSQSFRSYSVSSAENEGRCYAISSCLTKKSSFPSHTMNTFIAPSSSSKVAPHPGVLSNEEMPGTPRLVRSRAVRRDLVRDWNFDQVLLEG
ncbi:uncharacterized protein LOC129293319 isoform X2 [Prosopis cineraria]|nr:uncharacterized protein LOC129293319 isoform X2 [Prosopis cineraria]XP_054787200.1 uncharacterized protein LOC129293319 isoform X2 [Prosopis cineraria]